MGRGCKCWLWRFRQQKKGAPEPMIITTHKQFPNYKRYEIEY